MTSVSIYSFIDTIYLSDPKVKMTNEWNLAILLCRRPLLKKQFLLFYIWQKRFKWSVMYLYNTVQVITHVFVYYGSSERSCICIIRFKWSVCICILRFKWSVMFCILRFKWSVMYLYITVQVISHVFVYYGSSERSCICILLFKWAVMYLYNTVQVISHVFVYYGSGK